MKYLHLSTILEQIGGGVFLHGSGDPIIKHVLRYSEKDIDDHTLVFHMDRDQIRGKYWSGNKALVIITDKPEQCTDLGEEIILVKTENLDEAYFRFIDYYRGLFDIPIIGVTGTCGKTTTKEMIRQILEEDYKVKATWMSMNSMSVNLRYLTGIDDTTEVAIFEMPVAYPGYLKVSCQYFKPQIRILLNIGVHHLADCETPEAYMKAKAEIIEGLDPVNGILILNADDENIKQVLDPSPFQNVIYFGKSNQAQFRAENIRYENGGMGFTLVHNGYSYKVFVPGLGEHNVYNALAALAAVTQVNLDIQTGINRLADFEQVKEHLEFKSGENGCTIIDDSWNSAPLSMATALQVLKDVSKGKKAIALLGYMPQLGDGEHARKQYEQMGKKAVDIGIDELIVVGEEAEEIGKASLRYGMDPNKVYFCQTGDEVYKVLHPDLNDQTNVLIKVTHRVITRPTFKQLMERLIDENDE